MLDVGPAEVRYLCDRHAGLGADGLLRAVAAKHVEGWDGDGSLWFMDYRNADGSVAEMCGNGVRVFVRFLLDGGLATGPTVDVATRAGLRQAIVLPDGRIRVGMGPVTVGPARVQVNTVDGVQHDAVTADVGNPHAVSFVDDLAPLPLHAGPTWQPAEAFPNGANLEFVRRIGPRAHRHAGVRARGRRDPVLRHRHRRRGRGDGRGPGSSDRPVTYQVDVPGGTVEVELAEDQAYLTGPAVLVAHGEVHLPDFGSTQEGE